MKRYLRARLGIQSSLSALAQCGTTLPAADLCISCSCRYSCCTTLYPSLIPLCTSSTRTNKCTWSSPALYSGSKNGSHWVQRRLSKYPQQGKSQESKGGRTPAFVRLLTGNTTTLQGDPGGTVPTCTGNSNSLLAKPFSFFLLLLSSNKANKSNHPRCTLCKA